MCRACLEEDGDKAEKLAKNSGTCGTFQCLNPKVRREKTPAGKPQFGKTAKATQIE